MKNSFISIRTQDLTVPATKHSSDAVSYCSNMAPFKINCGDSGWSVLCVNASLRSWVALMSVALKGNYSYSLNAPPPPLPNGNRVDPGEH